MIKLNKETGELKLDYVTPILNEQTGVLTVSKTKEDLFTEKQVNQYFPIKYSREEVLNILDKFLESMLKGEKTGLIEEWFDETYGSKGSDECQFESTTNTSSATICKHCGREKFLHQ